MHRYNIQCLMIQSTLSTRSLMSKVRSFTLTASIVITLLAILIDIPRAQLYGTGASGDVTVTGKFTLSSDLHCVNLTVDSGVTLETNGYSIYVTGTLTNRGIINVVPMGGAGGVGNLGTRGGQGWVTHFPPEFGQANGIPTSGGTGNGGAGGGGNGAFNLAADVDRVVTADAVSVLTGRAPSFDDLTEQVFQRRFGY